jgi:hypothetical protein
VHTAAAMPRRSASALALMAALAVLVAGCGGGSTGSYRSEYTKAAAEFKRSVDEAQAKFAKAPKLSDRIPAIEVFRASMDRLAAKLEIADPPDSVKELNGRAVEVLHRFSGDLDGLRKAAAANDKHGVAGLAPRLQSDQAELQDVLDQIDQKLRD